jgi:hypothetical protein
VNELLGILGTLQKLGTATSPINTVLLILGVWILLKRTGALALDTTNAVQSTTTQLAAQVGHLATAIVELRGAVTNLSEAVHVMEISHARLEERVRAVERQPNT